MVVPTLGNNPWYMGWAVNHGTYSGQQTLVHRVANKSCDLAWALVHRLVNKWWYLDWAGNPGTENGQQIVVPILGNNPWYISWASKSW